MPDIGTLPPAQDAKPHVSLVTVLRAAGLPAAAVDELAAPGTMRALREAARHESTAAELAAVLTDDLYRVVPSLEDKRGRRAAVALRRDVHNGRLSAAGEARLQVLAPSLSDALHGRIERWAGLLRTAGERRSEAADLLDAEAARAGEALARHLSTPRITSGLALASPEFTDRLLAGPLSWRPESRAARSATAYLTRIALKTSPFSSLTSVGVSSFAGSAPGGGALPTAGTRVVSSARPLAVALLLAMVRHPEAASVLDVARVHGLRSVDGRRLATLPDRWVSQRTAFRVDALTDCGLYAWLLDLLPEKGVRFGDLAVNATPVGADAGLARRLVEIGLLQPVLPWRAASGRDFRALAQWAGRRLPPTLSPLAEALAGLAEQERIVVEETAAARRTVAVRAARSAAADAFEALGQATPPWVRDHPLFHEVDASPRTAGPELPPPVRDDLAEVGRWLVPHTWRHPLYDELLRCFVRRHGAGATGVDLVEFLYAFLDRADPTALAGLVPKADRATAGDPQRLLGDGTVAPAHHTVFFQVSAGTAAQVAAGEHETVVNAVHTGGMGLLGRWAGVPVIGERLGAPLADWAYQLHPGCRVYQVSPWADWSDLQRPVLRALPLLRAPGDLPTQGDLEDAEEATGMDGLTLAHQPRGATLQVLGRDGHPVAFSYLGSIPQHLLTGFAQLLCLLSNPWLTIGRIDRDRHVLDDDDGGRPVFRPRLQQGRIVWARARWTFPAEALPRPQEHGSVLDFIDSVHRWREQHGLPAEVFATRLSRSPGRVVKEKPQWLGFDHPHAIWAALGHIPPGVTAVDFAEALPSRSGHWALDSEGRGVATEFLGMMRHG
ncbi:lantibiotic dehydratase [Streptacidiphilus jiangxiensis]|uniref:lantibiotic dehydratase n=1 Tax=Streptacidiphilus jiangxiensis TaxID=235985 RepID=UPI001160669E|nr:lantibiotic dehydratase [Streptacidiphilus jiangxiensis]